MKVFGPAKQHPWRLFYRRQSVVQRSYNASIVRVVQEDSVSSRLSINTSAATPAAVAIDTSNNENRHTPDATVTSTRDAIDGVVSDGITGGHAEPNAEVTAEVVPPEGGSQKGILGLEMRIRLYEDGAMSQLLEQLAKVRCSLRHAVPHLIAGVVWYQQIGVRFIGGLRPAVVDSLVWSSFALNSVFLCMLWLRLSENGPRVKNINVALCTAVWCCAAKGCFLRGVRFPLNPHKATRNIFLSERKMKVRRSACCTRILPSVRLFSTCTDLTVLFGSTTLIVRNIFGEQDPVNAAVQLQGPFLVDSLQPPPAHRNVIMIAAGTGINPSTS